MNAEYIQLIRHVDLAKSGVGDSITLEIESGTPYRHLTIWMHGNVNNINFQPKFGNVDDGSAVNVTGGVVVQKIFQMDADEIRPATRNIPKYSNDGAPPAPMKTSIDITNKNPTGPVRINVYIVAAAAPGGT